MTVIPDPITAASVSELPLPEDPAKAASSNSSSVGILRTPRRPTPITIAAFSIDEWASSDM